MRQTTYMQTYLKHCWHALNKNIHPRKKTHGPPNMIRVSQGGLSFFEGGGGPPFWDAKSDPVLGGLSPGLAGTNNLWGGLGWHVAAEFHDWSSQIIQLLFFFVIYVWSWFSKDLGKHYENIYIYTCKYVYIYIHGMYMYIYIYTYIYIYILDILIIKVLGWSYLSWTSTRPLNNCWNATSALMPDVGLWKVTCFNVRLFSLCIGHGRLRTYG